MSICATVGRPVETGIDVCIHDGFVVFTEPLADQSFLYHLLKAQEPRWASTGQTGSQMNLNTDLIRRERVALPPEHEQVRIAQALTDTDTLIDSLEQLLTKKRQIKQGAMQELLTGKRRLPGFQDEWLARSMSDLFDFSGGLSASRDQLGDIGACYLHYGDIHLSNKTYIDLDLEHHEMPRLPVDLRKVSSTALLKDGDVVFVDASEDDQGVSKHVVIHCQVARPLISGLHTIVARPRTAELVDLYKRYCFQAPSVHAQFRFYAVGTKVSGVSKGNIGKIMLSVPSPAEQTEIAACLAEMDAEISAIEARLTKARALKQAMAQALLTGRIRLV
jgi:type I restriction enzyme S subunit